jgi:hypothetical protein
MLVTAIAVGDNPRLYAAAGAFGAVWWAWDLLVAHVFLPLGDWIRDTLMAGGVGLGNSDQRPSLDELIALLEGHLRSGTSEQVDLNAAIRLEEIYRTVKKDPERARAVIELVRQRYPDAPQLKQFGPTDGGGVGGEDLLDGSVSE